jgi:dipeptidyl aminopeptidase/acylaminoacyl peptidase
VEIAPGVQVALTDIPDPAPQLQGVGRQVLTYAREDGVRLAGVVYTPPGWDGETRLPTVLWAYPREFSNPEAAAQVPDRPTASPGSRAASHMFYLLEGYAIFDGALHPHRGRR